MHLIRCLTILKLTIPKTVTSNNWIDSVEKTGLIWLNLEPKHIQQLETLPLIHHDPFDRLLIAQAKVEHTRLLTRDKKIMQYDLR